MKILLAVAYFASVGLAMPAGSFSCPGGITNNTPMCCAANVLALAGLDCRPAGPQGCSGNGKPNCCTVGVAGNGILCHAL